LALPEAGIPSEVVASPDGTRCYISITKASGGTLTPGRNRVDSIDITTDTPLFERSVAVPSPSNFGPVGLAINRIGTRLYVGNRGAGQVHEIDVDPASPTRLTVLDSTTTRGDVVSVAVTP